MSKVSTSPSTVGTWSLTTARIATAGVLAGITLIMGLIPGLGFIPLPFGNATIEHIPVILGGVLEGPVVGLITGLVFGSISWYRALTTVPTPANAIFTLAFRNPLIAVAPRLLIGLFSWLVFSGLKGVNRDLAAVASGLVGSLTNTIFVVGLAIVLGYWPLYLAVAVIPQAILEAIVAAILTVLIARAIYVVRARLTHAPEKKPREQLPY